MSAIGVVRVPTVLVVAFAVFATSQALAQEAAEEQVINEREVHCAAPNSPLATRACLGLLDVDQGRWREGEASLESALALIGPELDSLRPVIAASLGTARQHLGSIDVTCGPVPAALEVDGVVQGTTPLLRPVRVLPGTHHVRCTQTDYQSAEADVEVSAMSVASTSLTMQVIDRRPILERIGNPGESQRIVGIVSLSLGGALLAVGFGTLAGALDNAPPLRDELFDVSRGTLIAGGAAVLLGVVLTLTAE